MSSRELSLFSYEVLGLVGRQGAGAHDLLRLARRAPFFNWAGESQYYTEPKRLTELGYLAARKEPGRTRQRTVYALTDKGLQALREWAQTPVMFTPLKSEPLVRLLIGDLVGEEVTAESMTTLRVDITRLQARLREVQHGAHQLPHRERYLQLVTDFMHCYFAIHLELIETVEREMSPLPASSPSAVAATTPVDQTGEVAR